MKPASRARWKIPVALASLAVVVAGAVALAGLLAWSLVAPAPYPDAARSRVSPPKIRLAARTGCLEWLIRSRVDYAIAQDPARVIARLKQSGWMRNYRYNNSVVDQTHRRYGPLDLVRINEMTVQNRSGEANLVSTVETTLSLGDCEGLAR
jgi:hypothetical protein